MSRPVWMEIGHDVLRVLSGGTMREWELQRDDHGRLTPEIVERLRRELPQFLARAAWHGRWPAWCAIGARGVTVRRLVLPVAGPGVDLESMVAMQVEAEFPLALEQLAWGYVPVGAAGSNGTGRDVLVVALKREVIDEYRVLFESCGLQTRFTLAALARVRGAAAAGPAGVLSLEAGFSEWAVFDERGLVRVRQFPWGVVRLETDYASASGVPLEGARDALRAWAHVGESDSTIDTVLARAFGDLAGDAIESPAWLGAVALPERKLVDSMNRAVPRARAWTGLGGSMEASQRVVRALEAASHEGGLESFPEIRAPIAEKRVVLGRGLPWMGVGAAAALLLLVLGLPHLEVWWMKPGLERKLAALKAEEPQLARLEAEWEFLRQLKQSQPPYLDALVVLTKSIPAGTQIESLSMNRQGDLVVRGMLRTPQDIIGFRSKLVESGFFAAVVVDEQTPTPDRQQVNYRITARWKEASGRERLPILALGDASTNPAAGSKSLRR